MLIVPTSTMTAKLEDITLDPAISKIPLIGFDNLVTQIEELMAKKPHAVIAISGFGGSGKSHLADQLRDHFKIKDSQTVRMDCLYSADPNGPGIFDQSDWTLFARILEDVREGKRLQYQGKCDNGEVIHCDEALPNLVIVEGIRLLQPRFMPSFDISVWIDCPQEFAKQRAKARDREQGNDEQTVNRWDTDWGPKDKEYFVTFRPDQLATYLYKDYK
jgi:uridine kinase